MTAAALLALIALMLFVGVGIGAMDISTGDLLRTAAGKLTGNDGLLSSVPENIRAVVWDIRLPRVLCAIFAGAGLAVAGVIFQGILQNPLADPYTLGISSGASFGASLAIYLSFVTETAFPTTPFALAGALITLAAVIAIAARGGGFESSALVMAGIIASSVLSSGVSLIKMLSGENVGAVVFWIMGSLASKTWSDAALIIPSVTILTAAAAALGAELDIMSLGDDTARSVGINTNRLRFIYLIIGAGLTAVCVSVCGVIGFVGLIVPHLLRLRFTSSNRALIPLSALSGAALLSAADNLTRIISRSEIPVGILTTLIGGPFFIYIFLRRKKR